MLFGNAGEYISGDGTDLKIISSGDVDITATLVDVTGQLKTSGNLSIGSNNELNEGDNYVGFKAPALSGDKIWVLPDTDQKIRFLKLWTITSGSTS